MNMSKTIMKKKLSEIIQKGTIKLVKCAVGRSLPASFHELDLPKEVREWAKK